MSEPLDARERAALEATIAWLRKQPSVRHAEVRFVAERGEKLRVRDGRPEQVTSSRSRGVGVRVLGERTWGFACTPSVDEGALVATAERAVRIAAAASKTARSATPFPERSALRGDYATPLRIDPFAVPLEEKLAALDAPVRALLGGGAPVTSAEAWMEWTRQDKVLLTTDGSDLRQSFTYGACGMQAFASAGAMSQKRSYPTWQGNEGFQGGYERIAELDLVGSAPRLREELVDLLSAPPCPAGERDLILDAGQMALQIHESCGHPTELDRALGSEVSLAGGSFLQPDMLGSFRYGSDLVNLVADATAPGALGTFGWDDEGTPAGTRPLVERGMFVDYLSSRSTAATLGRESTGTMRAESWNRTPLIRMVNVSLQPSASGTLEDLVADTKDGILVTTDKSWSIDDQRLDFQFSLELAWEIKNGKRTRLLRDPFYSGSTPRFWASCDAICGPDEFRMFGVNSCGKGDPIQLMHVGHGSSPARFRKVRIGNTGGGR